MPVDPPPDFDPLRMSYEAVVELRGFEHSGEVAEMLEREAEAQAHDDVPGGGVRVSRVTNPEQRDEFLSARARLSALTGQDWSDRSGEDTNVVPPSRGMPGIPDRGW
jgi:hypothetical protein